MTAEDYKFRVYVGSYGNYSNHDLRGGWISLPKSEHDLDEFLKDTVGINEENEEPMIQDWDTDLFHIGEGNIYEINVLAKLWEDLSPHQRNACLAFISDNDLDTLELANLFKQAEQIPFHAYDFENMENCNDFTLQEKLGYTMATENGFIDYVKEEYMDLLDYFDYKMYGETFELTGSYTLFENGYLENEYSINLYEYTWEDIVPHLIEEKSENIEYDNEFEFEI